MGRVGARTDWSGLIPQPEVNYGLYYDGVSVLSRRDGIVVQIRRKAATCSERT